MPAKSKAQQRLFGMVHAYQKGELKDASKEIKDIAKSISKKDAEDFAETKHKGLPNKVKKAKKKITEAQLRSVIAESIKNVLNEWAEPGEDKFYPGKYIFYPEDGKLAGDMGYEINDIAELVSNSPEELKNNIKEYFEDDYVSWDDERDPETPVILFVTKDTKTAFDGVYYISSLDKEYAPQIQAALGTGAKVIAVNPSNTLNESKLRNVIAEAIKSVLSEEGIHIKDENKGKFNATKKRTGKSTEELTHSKNLVTKKRAIFAQNAKSWNKGK